MKLKSQVREKRKKKGKMAGLMEISKNLEIWVQIPSLSFCSPSHPPHQHILDYYYMTHSHWALFKSFKHTSCMVHVFPVTTQ